MKRIIIAILCCLPLLAFSQKDDLAKDPAKEKRYYNSLSFGFNAGSSSTYSGWWWDSSPNRVVVGGIGFRYAAGYKHNRWLQVGAGTGFEFYDFGRPTVFVPIYAEAQGELTNWRVAPFYKVELGGGVRIPTEWDYYNNEFRGGAYFQPSAGFKFKRKNDFATTLSLGYQLQTASMDYDYSWEDDLHVGTQRRIWQRYVFRIGFLF